MKLWFHGAQYEYQPPQLEVNEGEVGGKYRGSTWKVHNYRVEHRRPLFAPNKLTYRGVSYERN